MKGYGRVKEGEKELWRGEENEKDYGGGKRMRRIMEGGRE